MKMLAKSPMIRKIRPKTSRASLVKIRQKSFASPEICLLPHVRSYTTFYKCFPSRTVHMLLQCLGNIHKTTSTYFLMKRLIFLHFWLFHWSMQNQGERHNEHHSKTNNVKPDKPPAILSTNCSFVKPERYSFSQKLELVNTVYFLI